MSVIRCYEGSAPPTPPTGVVNLYAKTDGRWYFMADDGTEYPMKSVGAGSGDLLADGSIPLTGNWNAVLSITVNTLTSTATTGTPPFVVASTTLVTNLNADQLDGNEATAFATAAQGALADTALQSADLTGYLQQTDIDSLAELNAIVLDATLIDSASLATVATSGDSDDLTEGSTNLLLTSAERTAIAGMSNSALNKVITGTTYTILAADDGYNLIFTNAAAIAVTLPDTLDTDFQCTIVQTTAAGIPTVTPNTDTINGAGTGVAPADQWKAMYLTQYAATEWLALL